MKTMIYTSIMVFICAIVLLTVLASCEGGNKVRFINDYTIYTDTIRNHVYMHTIRGGLLHAPDCQCFTDTIQIK